MRKLSCLFLPVLLAACGLKVQLGDKAASSVRSPKPAAAKKKPRGTEEEAIRSALEYVEAQEHSYRISPADLVEIRVYQEPDLGRTVRVSPKGIITFPLIGKVGISGKSVPEAEQAVRDKLKRYVIDPQISIFIKEYGNKQVYVLGEVKKPGSYSLPTEAPLTVIEAISLAGGFTQYAAVDRTRVIRKGGGKERSIVIEVSAITKRGDKSEDIALDPGDVIFVPESFF